VFDISFAKLFVLGMVALIVLGPEKLTTVARIAGIMLGRTQRFVANVKAEMHQQLEETGLNKIQLDVQQSAQNMRDGLQTALSEMQQSLEEANQAYLVEKEKTQNLTTEPHPDKTNLTTEQQQPEQDIPLKHNTHD
jgi:sec-independent protein translocase protein TatB